MNMRLRLLSPTRDLVRVVDATLDLQPEVVPFDGRRYLRDKRTGDQDGEVPIFDYVEERTYAVSA